MQKETIKLISIKNYLIQYIKNTITSICNQYRNYCDIRWKLTPGLWQLATHFACTQLRCLMVISSAQPARVAIGPHTVLEYGRSGRSPSTVLSFIVVLSVLFWGCRTESLVWPVWCIPANTWKTGTHKCRSPDTTVSVLSVSAASCCSNRNCGAWAWESHVEGTCGGEKMPTETFMRVSWGPQVSLKCLAPKTWDVVRASWEDLHTSLKASPAERLAAWAVTSSRSICMLVWAGAAGWRKHCPPMASIGSAKEFLWVFPYSAMDKSGMNFLANPVFPQSMLLAKEEHDKSFGFTV